MGVVGLYAGVKELCHWWKYGNMNLSINLWYERRSMISRGWSVLS